jgi:signal peptidase I
MDLSDSLTPGGEGDGESLAPPTMWRDRRTRAAKGAAVSVKRRRPLRTALVVLVLGVLLAGSAAVPLLTGYHAYNASSGSMAPGIRPGDRVVTHTGGTPERGDLVLVDATAWGTGPLAFRRVIGVGGDRVACCTAGRVTVDGKPLAEPYTAATGSANAGQPDYAVTVPAGRLFLLGDNRADAVDSRTNLTRDQGTLPVSAVKGRVVWEAQGGAVAGADGSLAVYVGLVGFGLLLAGLALIALLVSAVVSASRRRSRPAVASPAGTPA